jgi:HSP20 family protein
MTLKEISPWRRGGLKRWDEADRPYESFLQQMDALHKEMDSLFEEFWNGNGHMTHLHNPEIFGPLSPQVDEIEDDNAIHIKVELPGMDKEDVDISLSGGMLTIKGEKKREEEEKGKDFYRKERSFGSFRRTLPIPVEVDEAKIRASFKKGILSIDLPKTPEARKKVKHITVKAA